jgi:hypothetical protein
MADNNAVPLAVEPILSLSLLQRPRARADCIHRQTKKQRGEPRPRGGRAGETRAEQVFYPYHLLLLPLRFPSASLPPHKYQQRQPLSRLPSRPVLFTPPLPFRRRPTGLPFAVHHRRPHRSWDPPHCLKTRSLPPLPVSGVARGTNGRGGTRVRGSSSACAPSPHPRPFAPPEPPGGECGTRAAPNSPRHAGDMVSPPSSCRCGFAADLHRCYSRARSPALLSLSPFLFFLFRSSAHLLASLISRYNRQLLLLDSRPRCRRIQTLLV